jgi:DNA-directed RNA polymerase specialized sigma24 family protein
VHAISGNQGFPTTNWELFERLRTTDALTRTAARDELLKRYWPVVRRFLIVSHGLSILEAEDVQSSFTLDRLAAGESLFDIASSDRGRFRNLLARSIENYLIDRYRRKQRDASYVAVNHLFTEPSVDFEPLAAFEHAWACSVVQTALNATRTYLFNTDQSVIWHVFERRIVMPALGYGEQASYTELVREFSLRDPIHASNLLSTAKRVFSRQLEAVLAEHAEPGEDFRRQLAELRKILSLPAD